MDRNDRIAVLMATCNGAKYLRRQLESIFVQSYRHFHLYIADDASEDGTQAIVREFGERFPGRIDFHVNRERLGFVKNFENLLGRCDDSYTVFCDQDDIWEEGKLQRQMEAMRELESRTPARPCMIHSDLRMIDGEGRPLADSYFRFRGYQLHDRKDLGHILGPCGVLGNTVMINSALRKKLLPFPADLDVHDYWIALVAELYGRRRTIREPLVAYRIHEMNSSNSLHRLRRGASLARWLRGDLRLPYMETRRAELMRYLLSLPLEAEERRRIEAFYRYLTFSKSRLGMYADLLRFSLVKRRKGFKALLLLKILLSKRYRHGDRHPQLSGKASEEHGE